MSDEIRPSAASASDADWDAISRFVAGESDAVESAAVAQWLATHPEDAAVVAVVKARAQRIDERSAVPIDTERALLAVRSRMADGPPLTVHRGGASTDAVGIRSARGWRGAVLAAAAAVAAMVGIAQWRGTTTATDPAYAPRV